MISLVANNLIIPEIILRSTISISTNLLYSYKYLLSLSHTDIILKDILKQNDLLADMLVIRTYVIEKDKLNIHLNESIKICLQNLNRTLTEIENIINSITHKLQIHKTLWFHNFRSYNISEEKSQLPFLIEKLKHRFELLIKISSIS
jgi:hypothetical protein